MIRVFIVHCWGGEPESNWYPWLAQQLKEYEVHVPAMPNPDTPEIEEWVKHLRKIVGKLDTNTYFVGHSIGCQTILRYLEKEQGCGGAVFVAGWFNLTPEATPTEEEEQIAKPWIETPIDFEKIKGKFTAIFSADDPLVDIVNAHDFQHELHAHIVTENGRGHFTADDGVTQVPEVVRELQALIATSSR